ncbi:hypothetical protein MBLNU459_g7377t1 [Dothideomycetes sp. NU459]
MPPPTRHAATCFVCAFRIHSARAARLRIDSRRPFSATSAVAAASNPHAAPFSAEPGRSVFRLDLGRDHHRGGDRKATRGRAGPGRGGGGGPGRGGRLSDRPFGRPKQNFGEVLLLRLAEVKKELEDAPIVSQLAKDDLSFKEVWKAFSSRILDGRVDSGAQTSTRAAADRQAEQQALRDSYYDRGVNSLDDRLKYAFYHFITNSRFTESDIRNQKDLADLRYPTEWFPATRTMHRTIHLHVGPTNSGKTYHALKRLEQADTGVYAGPLRLLAHEIYTRLNAKGKRCTLITGEEKRSPDDSLTSDMQSCTVEMMPLNKKCDVAVIDEIQMIGNAERGWAWTQALLGVKATEVHLCGEARTVPLIRELCASIGEKLEVHEYTRLSPLQMADQSLKGDLRKLKKGDCIVSFSVMGIHALRKQIERDTGKKVATVYGGLPPETRAQQARLFNDPDNDYDFLVASDAIGMGLNLSIKRIIFESSSKYDGFNQRTLSIADIKQIGGRAGRYRSAHQDTEASKEKEKEKELQDLTAAKGEDKPVEIVSRPSASTSPMAEASGVAPVAPISSTQGTDDISSDSSRPAASLKSASSSVGLVTTLEDFDFPVIQRAMKGEPEPIRTAGIFPPAPIIERFATYFPPGTPFSYILMRLHELSQMHSRFHLCGLKDQLWIADLIEPVQGLTTADRNILCACPAGKSDSDLFKNLFPAFARCIEQQSGGSLLEIAEMPLEVLELEVSANRDYLRQLERLHKGLVAYLWLSYRFAGIFVTRPLAFYVKGLVEEKIETVLSQFSFAESQRKKITAAREKSMLEDLKREIMMDSRGKSSDVLSDGSVSNEGLVDETTPPYDTQTSYAAGGDRFGGESDFDVMTPVEALDPEDLDSISADAAEEQDVPSKQPTTNFAQWRLSHLNPRDEDELSWHQRVETGKTEKEADPTVTVEVGQSHSDDFIHSQQ